MAVTVNARPMGTPSISMALVPRTATERAVMRMSSMAMASAPALRSSWMMSLTEVGSNDPSPSTTIPCPSTAPSPPNASTRSRSSWPIAKLDCPSAAARS